MREGAKMRWRPEDKCFLTDVLKKENRSTVIHCHWGQMVASSPLSVGALLRGIDGRAINFSKRMFDNESDESP